MTLRQLIIQIEVPRVFNCVLSSGNLGPNLGPLSLAIVSTSTLFLWHRNHANHSNQTLASHHHASNRNISHVDRSLQRGAAARCICRMDSKRGCAAQSISMLQPASLERISYHNVNTRLKHFEICAHSCHSTLPFQFTVSLLLHAIIRSKKWQ